MATRGRPLKGKERPTRQIRMYADQWEVLGWISRIEQKSTAKLIDEILGEELGKRYRRYKSQVVALNRVEEEVRKALGQPAGPPLPPFEGEEEE